MIGESTISGPCQRYDGLFEAPYLQTGHSMRLTWINDIVHNQTLTMDPLESRKCRWEGCHSFDVMLGGVFCLEHKTQFHLGRRLSSPINEKKQLPEKHTARKSVKQPSNLGQASTASATSLVRKPSADTSPRNPRPVKKQRPSGVPSVSGLHSRSSSSSFSENGISHLSSRDDFALRPKKKETASESARSKPYNDQRQPHRGDIHLSNSSRPAPTLSKPPQPISIKTNVRPGSLVIDLTGDDDPVPPLSRPRLQPSPNNHTPNGITAGLQKPQRSDESHNLPCNQNDIPASDNKKLCEGSPLSQPGGNSQVHPGHLIEQTRDLHAQNPSQNVIPNAATVQPAPKPLNGTNSEAPISKQKSNTPTLNGLEPMHIDSSDTCTRERELPPVEDPQLTNGIGQPSPDPDEKSLASGDSSPDSSVTEQTMAKKTIKFLVKKKPVPNAAPTQAIEVAPQTTIRQGPLTALLGGREWKRMTPEERRLFWVSQHDEAKFDAEIYSEYNRPFRPGDPLFGLAEDELPPRPQRPATHFDYIDPRIHYSHQKPKEWYERKRMEISACGNRKTGFGEVIERIAERKREEASKRKILPQRVRDNPKWLAAIPILEQIEVQERRKKAAKGKERATPTVPVDSDTEMQSS